MKGNVLNFTAETAVPAFRFAKAGTTEGNVKLAGAGETALGATGELDTAEGCRCDVQLDGIAEVECGGSVTFGVALEPDANGRLLPHRPLRDARPPLKAVRLATSSA